MVGRFIGFVEQMKHGCGLSWRWKTQWCCPSCWRRTTKCRSFEQFMERRWARCKLVVEASVQVGEWELNPTPTSINDAIALSDQVRATLAHAF